MPRGPKGEKRIAECDRHVHFVPQAFGLRRWHLPGGNHSAVCWMARFCRDACRWRSAVR
jgi:hypothetical protein